MNIAAFRAVSPFEIGDKVQNSETGKVHTITDIACIMTRDMDPETYAISIKVEQGINTLTVYGENESEKFSKIKCVRTLDTIDYDTGYLAAQSVIGEYDNNDDGRASLISLFKRYLETLVEAGAISADFLSEVDEAFVSEGDVVYLKTQSLTVDKIEKIFNSIYV